MAGASAARCDPTGRNAIGPPEITVSRSTTIFGARRRPFATACYRDISGAVNRQTWNNVVDHVAGAGAQAPIGDGWGCAALNSARAKPDRATAIGALNTMAQMIVHQDSLEPQRERSSATRQAGDCARLRARQQLRRPHRPNTRGRRRGDAGIPSRCTRGCLRFASAWMVERYEAPSERWR